MELSDSRYRILQPNQMEESSNTANFTTNTRSTGAGAAASSSLPDATDEVQEGNRTRREHMFAKVVTPSDVGKLNRLVIPKQHAEKYFPLEACSNDQKGLLLNFEDSSGKSWRFRYSYWNSSQSYVMTKGWSRFVKEKKLIAGDIVSFERTVNQSGEACRLFIGWKRRPNAPPDSLSLVGSNKFWPISSDRPTTVPSWRHGGYSRDYYGYGLGYVEPQINPLFYLRAGTRPTVHRDRPDAIAVTRHDISPTATLESVPLVHVKTAAKRVRLFGVNLDCPAAMEEEDEDEEETDGSTCGIGGSVCDVRDGISCSSSMPNWFPQNPSEHLQSRLLAGENTQLLTLPTFSQPELSRKSKPPSLSFNL